MNKNVARILGPVVATLCIVGFLAGDGRWLGLVNVDTFIDILRVPIAIALLYVGFGNSTESTARSVVGVVGALYIGMALIGLFSQSLFGLLPNELTTFDIIFHTATGIAALIVAYKVPMERHLAS
jgi:hypothetical protein